MSLQQLYIDDDSRYCGGFIDEDCKFYASEAEYYWQRGFWDAIKGRHPEEHELFDHNYMLGYRSGKKEQIALL